MKNVYRIGFYGRMVLQIGFQQNIRKLKNDSFTSEISFDMENRSYFIFTFFFFLCLSLQAQERLGLSIGNYSGVNGLVINPAYGTSLPYSWDVNIVSVGLFADNNYGFIKDASLLSIIKNGGNVEFANTSDTENQTAPNALIADYNKGKNFYYAQGNVHIMGPSFLAKMKDKHSFGLLTSMRAMAGTRKIPNALGYYEFEEYLKEQEIGIGKFRIAGAAWSEIGIHYGYDTEENLAFGVNAKYLMGYEGFYFGNKKKTGVIKHDNNVVDFLEANAEFGITNTYASDQNFNGIKKNGSGLALDLGVTYTIDRDYDDGYLLKLGVSIIDLGYINFNKNSEVHEISNVDLFSLDLDDYQSVETYDELITMSNNDIFGSLDVSKKGSDFSLTLPTALSLQADYSINKNLFVNATLVQHIPLGKNRLARTDILAISPRFEHRWFGAMLPISVLNYDQIHVGLSLRLAYLTIGSENLASLFASSSDFTGTDFYLALKVNPIKITKRKKNKKWKSRDARGVRPRGRGKVKCYF